MISEAVYTHNIIVVGDPHDPLYRVIINYWIKEDMQLESVDLIEKIVTPINNPERN